MPTIESILIHGYFFGVGLAVWWLVRTEKDWRRRDRKGRIHRVFAGDIAATFAAVLWPFTLLMALVYGIVDTLSRRR